MRVLIVEFLTSGAMSNQNLESSLLREGDAMLHALVNSCESCESVRPIVLRDARLPALQTSSVECHTINSVEQFESALDHFCRTTERNLIVAPESAETLETLVQKSLRVAGVEKSLNCTPELIGLCGDKLLVRDALSRSGIQTIPTELLSVWMPSEFPVVVKPRDGAGCEQTYFVRDRDTFLHQQNLLHQSGAERMIVQPWVEGVALSSGLIQTLQGDSPVYFPVGKQHLEVADTFRYLGGEFPWNDDDFAEANQATRTVMERVVELFPGIVGYIGFDWLWCRKRRKLTLVEINPRITTSVVGYEFLWPGVVMNCLLGKCVEHPLLSDRNFRRFDADGTQR